MIVNTDKLEKAITNYYNKVGESTEKIKSNDRAIKLLTALETNEIRDRKIIADFIALYNQFYS